MAEDIEAIEKRAAYYDATGAIQRYGSESSHAMELYSVCQLGVPAIFESESHHDRKKIKVFRTIPAIEFDNVVLGQYTEGTIDGEKVADYLMSRV